MLPEDRPPLQAKSGPPKYLPPPPPPPLEELEGEDGDWPDPCPWLGTEEANKPSPVIEPMLNMLEKLMT